MKLHTMTLAEATAAELMMANPISLRASASLPEATKLFREKGISAAPVIDSAGHPIGVVSRSDLLIHQSVSNEGKSHSYYDDADVARREGSDEEAESPMTVADVMTPAVFAVAPDTPSHKVVQDMLGFQVHRLFVVGADGVLVGVISSMDILRHLKG